tara:strand:+ start:78 stop:482 length:405 start_codon:yes stop_codon:yes gene_type:complete
MDWLLYILTFVFGYVTCKTFYFMGATRLALNLVRGASVIYVSVMAKAAEKLSYTQEIMLENMIKTEKNSAEISAFQLQFDGEVSHLKKTSIDVMIALHPEFFKQMIEFDDWDSAMEYADQYREQIFKFWDIKRR